MAGWGATQKGSDTLPLGSVQVPNVVNPIPLMGGTPVADTAGNLSAPVAVVQSAQLSAGNSSIGNLGAGASFTGTSASTLGVAAIQVSIFADQNCTIQVKQALQDPGTSWDIIDSWTYTANSNGQDATRTIQALGASCQIIATNNGGLTTTALRLTTVLCPVADPLPRTLTQLGNLKIAPQEPTLLSNGATFDQQRGNVNTGGLISAAGATTTQVSADQTNINGRGVVAILNMTAVGTGSVTLNIQGKDSVSGNYYTIASSAIIVTNIMTVLTVYPGITVTANVNVNNVLPRTWRVQAVANNANATTYTVAASVIV